MQKIVTLLLFIFLAGASAAVRAADFSGLWTLDAKASRNLPPFYAGVKSHRLAVAQDADRLKVAVEIDAGRGAPDRFEFVYRLDGAETATETEIRTPDGLKKVPTRLAARTRADGRLEITITRELKMPDGDFTAVTVEEWELAKDGRTLTVRRTDEMPQGPRSSELVFVKK